MAQLQKGTTYITGDQVTAANLNALVDSGTLIAGAITDQTAKTVPLAADTILLHSAADTALRKTTMTQLFATPQPLGATTPSSVAATTGTFSSTLGVTGVATLGNGAILGTPASGTVTNLTGTASININGTVGATTPSTVAATTISASGLVTASGSGERIRVTTSGNYTSSGAGYIGFTDASTNTAYVGFGGVSNVLDIQTNITGGRIDIVPATIRVAAFSSTGAAITGTLSATGGITNTTGSGTASVLGLAQTGIIRWDITNEATSGLLKVGVNGGGNILTLTNATGLAVTGTLSATTGAAVGGATAGAGGLAFPATAVAVADANTLDDYEEGTWTPSVGGTATYSIQQGSYIKVGRLVTVSFDMEILLLGTGSTTGFSGLPFTAGSATSPKMEQGTGAMGYIGLLAVNVYSLTFYAAANGTTMNSISMNTLGGTANVNPAIYGNGTRVQGTVTYIST